MNLIPKNYWIPENSHLYWPAFVVPYFKKDLIGTVEFPTSSWYDDYVQPGFNKLLMIGKLIHYKSYCTIGWQWWPADGLDVPEEWIFKGRVIMMGLVYHYNWSAPNWEILGFYDYRSPIKWRIYRTETGTIYEVEQDDNFNMHISDQIISGYWLRSPYFGGRSKSLYQHTIKIKVI